MPEDIDNTLDPKDEEVADAVTSVVYERLWYFLRQFALVSFKTAPKGSDLTDKDILYRTSTTRALVRCAEKGVFKPAWRDNGDLPEYILQLSKKLDEAMAGGETPDGDQVGVRILFEDRILSLSVAAVGDLCNYVEDATLGEVKVLTKGDES